MKKKMSLDSLEVKSFVTGDTQKVRGGIVQTEWCSGPPKYCSLNFCESADRECTVTEAPNC
jgi:hypothetical protein